MSSMGMSLVDRVRTAYQPYGGSDIPVSEERFPLWHLSRGSIAAKIRESWRYAEGKQERNWKMESDAIRGQYGNIT